MSARPSTAAGADAAALPPVPDLGRLPAMAVADRIPLVRERIAERAEAMLVTRLFNIRYLTGFTGSAALLLLTPDEIVFVTDGRYGEQAAAQLRRAGVDARIEVTSTGQRELLATAAAGVPRLALEAEDVTWAHQRRLADTWFPDVELVATEHLVEGLRMVKDEGEVARIEAAAIIADHALARIRPMLADGETERDIAVELDAQMRRLGAEDRSFETIVGSGPNGAMPHARPTTRRVHEGDLVVIDFGALVDGYCSDMTRTVMVGEPSATQRRMLDVVREAQQAGVDAVAAGVEVRAIDQACRSVIEGAGWGDAFLHATGHGVGLEIHEPPRVGATGDATLAPGHVVTVEPGVYLPDHGGVRIEDTVVVTDEGCRPLTHTSKRSAL